MLHQKLSSLGSAAVGAQDLGTVGQESTADQRGGAAVTYETLSVPVPIVEGDELGSTESSDCLEASAALLSKKLSKAISTKRLFIL